jgi:hypothetical protein
MVGAERRGKALHGEAPALSSVVQAEDGMPSRRAVMVA